MAFTAIDNFRHYVPSIARPTLFDVKVNFTAGGGDIINTDTFMFTCKSAGIPSSTFGKIEVPYLGRKIYFPGDRQYNEWTTTVIVDGDWESYKAIYDWHQRINGARNNKATQIDVNRFKSTAEITTYRPDGSTSMIIRLDGFFPMDLQELQMDWSSTDSTADLSVTWSYDFSEMVFHSQGVYKNDR
jgi:hypothetical protein